ncbi:MAG TPA: hypothetical protein EYP22_04810 [Methanosarcinales archaeon]|nr:hypothetical protein [Methanosarcinales archaeon]
MWKINKQNLKNGMIVIIAALSLITVLPLAMAETNISIKNCFLSIKCCTLVKRKVVNCTY